MFQCPGCGAPVRFDPASQMMRCSYCESQFDPDTFAVGKAAHESTLTDAASKAAYDDTHYEATIFTCPQCGGELAATENSAAEFCSFCGSPVVLESRLSKMESPKYIIPFKKTKQECADAFHQDLKKAFFAPSKFKNGEVESFRGIYMPNWNFNIVQKTRGYVYVEEAVPGADSTFYKVFADLDARYEGVPHDASEAFADHISESLEPYNYKERKPFTPAYIAGFFSDSKDVPYENYLVDSLEIANEHTLEKFKAKATADPHVSPSVYHNAKPNEAFNTLVDSVDSTLVPVWFLSYRQGKRVAYAAVNGESGKVYSDTPVSVPLVLLFSFLLSLPIFGLLNLTVSMRANSLVLLCMILLTVTNLIYMGQLTRILEREANHLFEKAEKEAYAPKKAKKEKEPITLKKLFLAGLSLLGGILALYLLYHLGLFVFELVFELVGLFCILLSLVLPIYGLVNFKKKDKKKILPMRPHGFIPLFIAALYCAGIYTTDPVSDVSHYAAAIAAFAAITVALMNIIRTLNLLTTRPLPQFRKRGGEEHA